ncbi:hypothetical protein [Mycolicibacterium goodii]|uniref:Uncharacterized protein n=1 Tax=Mycolicibacterium goodii TaxID=134601 RepID=A0ABS6HV46_MYCGD|nr:hypothetical protein [Mycolicibacterium goodii]MBU8811469.1 hypothetical protein [Mycolicibacterium goodii]MBU8819457.1 hypothetical protein [Mycolicibacterium goodii]MBU8826098.1 hypothetical protein [Mycolicibacterium goodii]MBU8831988.1 hypothetical protein [Mycolicibacterium goodii]MBU8839378.1 hypothetical protein [Mycolicibacterium goodii]
MGTINVKLLAAGAGAVAVVAFGTLGAMTGATASASGSKMNVGQTSVESTPPTAPPIPMAVPKIKGPAPLPSEEKAAE